MVKRAEQEGLRRDLQDRYLVKALELGIDSFVNQSIQSKQHLFGYD